MVWLPATALCSPLPLILIHRFCDHAVVKVFCCPQTAIPHLATSHHYWVLSRSSVAVGLLKVNSQPVCLIYQCSFARSKSSVVISIHKCFHSKLGWSQSQQAHGPLVSSSWRNRQLWFIISWHYTIIQQKSPCDHLICFLSSCFAATNKTYNILFSHTLTHTNFDIPKGKRLSTLKITK